MFTLGHDCDLLIHEATMEDELEEDARIKTHCTTSQAIKASIIHSSRKVEQIPCKLSLLYSGVHCCLKNYEQTMKSRMCVCWYMNKMPHNPVDIAFAS